MTRKSSLLSRLRNNVRIRFGFDAFIAYNRDTAGVYARKLHESLTSEPYRLVCFIDERGFKPGTHLRPQTIVSLLFSHMLIVVFTSKARLSPYVRREVSIFLWLRKWFFWRRPISVLDAEGEWKRALSTPSALEEPWSCLAKETQKKLLIYEEETMFESGEPSPRIKKRYGEWKQFEQLRRRDVRVVLGSVIAAVVLALVAAATGFVAEKTFRSSQKAEEARKSAIALKLGAQAQQLVSQPHGLGAEPGTLLAVEALRREQNLDASLALLDGLSLLPKPLKSVSVWNGTRYPAILVPTAHRALLWEDSRDFASQYFIAEIPSQKRIALELEKLESEPIAFSESGAFVLVASNERLEEDDFTWFQVCDLTNGRPTAPTLRVKGQMAHSDSRVAVLNREGSAFCALMQGSNSDSNCVFISAHATGIVRSVTLPFHDTSPIQAFSDDGKWVAVLRDSQINTNIVDLWNLNNQQSRDSRRGGANALIHSGEVHAAMFSSDGTFLATAQGAPTFKAGTSQTVGKPMVRIWETLTGREIGNSMVHPVPVQTMAFSPDGSKIATLDRDDNVRVWTTSGDLLKVKLNREAKFSGDSSPQILLQNEILHILQNKNFRQDPENEEEEVFDVVMETFSLQDANSERICVPLPEESDTFVGVFSADGKRMVFKTKRGIAIGSQYGSRQDILLSNEVKSATFSPDGNWIIVTRERGEIGTDQELVVTLISATTGEVQWEGRVPTEDAGEAYVSNNRIVAVQVGFRFDHPGTNTFVFDTKTGNQRSWEFGVPPPGFPEDPNGWVWPAIGYYRPGLVAISPNGTRLLLENEIRDVRTGEILVKIPPNIGKTAVSFGRSEEEIYVATGSTEAEYAVWNSKKSKLLEKRWRLPTGRGGLSRNSEFSVIPDDNFVWVYRTTDGAPVFRIDFGGRVNDAAFSPAGKWLLVTGESASLRAYLWQPDDLIRVAARYVTRDLDTNELKTYLPNEAIDH